LYESRNIIFEISNACESLHCLEKQSLLVVLKQTANSLCNNLLDSYVLTKQA